MRAFFLSLAHKDEFITVHVILEKANGNFLLQGRKMKAFHFCSVLCFKKFLLLVNVFNSNPLSQHSGKDLPFENKH